MSGARWVTMRKETAAICSACVQPFSYIRTGNKPRVRCEPCRRSRKLGQIRVHCTEYRRLERQRLEAAHA